MLSYSTTSSLPKEYVFLNYLRCHDDIGWGLDYTWLMQFGISEVSHKKYLNEFFTGKYPNSFARGELYNADPKSGDARLCGTTASLCGIEKAIYEQNSENLEKAISLDIMLHAYMLIQSGIPVIYSGDEIGQKNDYSYHDNAKRCEDSRYLHRGKFQWNLASKRIEKESVEEKIFSGIKNIEEIRKQFSVFSSNADVYTIDTDDKSILGIVRANKNEKLIALFNFSEYDKIVPIDEFDSGYIELISNIKIQTNKIKIPAYGVYWLLKR